MIKKAADIMRYAVPLILFLCLIGGCAGMRLDYLESERVRRESMGIQERPENKEERLALLERMEGEERESGEEALESEVHAKLVSEGLKQKELEEEGEEQAEPLQIEPEMVEEGELQEEGLISPEEIDEFSDDLSSLESMDIDTDDDSFMDDDLSFGMEDDADKGGLPGLIEKGSVETRYYGQFYEVKNDRRQDIFEGIVKLDMRHDFLNNYSLILNPVIHTANRNFTAEFINRIQETGENKAKERRYYLNADEAYVVRRGENADLFFGKKEFTWGKAEVFNPTDSINPYDLMDFLESSKIGVLSTGIEYSIGESSIDLVFIPLFTFSRTPHADNRWAGNQEDELDPSSQKTQRDAIFDDDSPTVEVHERELPPNTIESSQVAARYRTTVKGWDFSLSYYHGFDSIPTIESETKGGVTHLTPVFNKINVAGLAVATTFDKLEAHGEMAYRHTEQGDDDNFIAYIIGGSYNWNLEDYDLKFLKEVSLYFEFAGEEITDVIHNENRVSSSYYSRPFKESVLGSLNLKINEDTEVHVGGNYNIDEYDYLIQPKLTHNFTDDLKLKAGLDLITGHKDTFYGKWRKNDRLFTNLTWHF